MDDVSGVVYGHGVPGVYKEAGTMVGSREAGTMVGSREAGIPQGVWRRVYHRVYGGGYIPPCR